MLRLLLLIAISAFSQLAVAQEYKPKGSFQVDSARVGEEIPYSLSFTYPRDWQVLFPDSLGNYSPFEYSGRIFFPTVTDSLSTDSTIYYLSTYELDEIQLLRLPVKVRKPNGDTTTLYTDYSQISLIQVVTQLPDSLDFKENTFYRNVKTAFNYPYLLAGLFLLTAALIAVWIIFGKRIRKWFAIRRLTKSHKIFLNKYRKLQPDAAFGANLEETEKLLFIWKKYLETLEKAPFTKLTTREILKIVNVNGLDKALKAVDRAIYARIKGEDLDLAFKIMEEVSIDQYQQKVNSIKND
ncbi:hypothetical protein [Peijinzhouia sedimentorum]